MKRQLWEILIPIADNDRHKFTAEKHRAWDKRVRDISGGITIFKPAVGQWVNGDEVMTDTVIPVAFMATREQAFQIADYSKSYYKQEAMFFYVLANEVHIR